VLEAIVADTGRAHPELREDGGMVANTLLMRFQADILGIDDVVPAVTETTVLGAAFGAGMAAGLWSGPEEVALQWNEAVRYRPSMSEDTRAEYLRGWNKAVDRSLDWIGA
jgi:glycerol kinase